MNHEAGSEDFSKGSPGGGRVVLAVFGIVFLVFGVREFQWHEGLGIVGAMCILASFPFFGLAAFGSNSVIQSLFKRRGVPRKD